MLWLLAWQLQSFNRDWAKHLPAELLLFAFWELRADMCKCQKREEFVSMLTSGLLNASILFVINLALADRCWVA